MLGKNKKESPAMCCDNLLKMNIAWYMLEDGTKVMPFISGENSVSYRVNYCPSCGTYIRNIKIKP
jgi:hypothetical protein